MSETAFAEAARQQIAKEMLDSDPELRSWAHSFLAGEWLPVDASQTVFGIMLQEDEKLRRFVRAYLKVYP